MHRAEEVTACADLHVSVERERGLIDLEWRELVAQLAQQFHVKDELLVTGDQSTL
jgi:hypothetical protein